MKTLKLLEAEAPTSTFAKVLSLLRLHRGAEVLLLPRLELGRLGFGAPSAAFRGFKGLVFWGLGFSFLGFRVQAEGQP